MPKRRMKRHAVTQPTDASYRFIPLTQRQNAIVDANDFEWLSQWNWFASWSIRGQRFYAIREERHSGRRKRIPMQSQILRCLDGEEGDHKNGDSLDNRRENVRKATRMTNMRNSRMRKDVTSGYKGVSRCDSIKNPWRATIMVNQKSMHLGCFPSAWDAACAYDEAAIQIFGEFAHPNFSHQTPATT